MLARTYRSEYPPCIFFHALARAYQCRPSSTPSYRAGTLYAPHSSFRWCSCAAGAMPRGTDRRHRQFAAEARSSLDSLQGATRQVTTHDPAGMLQKLGDDLVAFWSKYKQPFSDWWLALPRRDKAGVVCCKC